MPLEVAKATPVSKVPTELAMGAVAASSDQEREGQPDVEREEGETRLEYVQRRTKEFNKRLRDEPSDIKLWHEYINFQVRSQESLLLPLLSRDVIPRRVLATFYITRHSPCVAHYMPIVIQGEVTNTQHGSTCLLRWQCLSWFV